MAKKPYSDMEFLLAVIKDCKKKLMKRKSKETKLLFAASE